jgi:predicted DNA-binding transcriptional regulator YafY
MKSARLLTLLLLLQTRRRMTAQRLADELQVSVRTVYRDVNALSSAGVPVYSETGADGGYRLVDGYETRLNGLTRDEAQALLLLGLRGPIEDLGLGPLLDGAELKMRSSLPAHLRDDLDRLRSVIHLDVRGRSRPDDAAKLANLGSAARRGIVVVVEYPDATGAPTPRRIEPLGLVLSAEDWHLVAAPTGAAPRAYLVRAVTSVRSTGGGFARPADFDLAACWAALTHDPRHEGR